MSKGIKVPKISIIVLTLNEAGYLKKCLASVRSQSYPQEKVEIVVVDNGSKDKSVNVAKSYDARVFINKKGDVYRNWAIALHKITGDFVYMIDQDIELRGKDFFQKMLKPLICDRRIIASFTRKYVRKDQAWVTRFLSYHPAQCDPLYEFLTPPLKKSFIGEMDDYTLCKFKLGLVPPFGRMFYRVKYLKKTPNWKLNKVFDHDLIIKSIKSGYNLFAYVPIAGLYHYHARSLKHLLFKRARNLRMHYLPENETTEYRWLDINDRKKIIRLLAWIIYANLFFPAFFRGLIKFFKYKDWVLLMEPVVTIATTDVILWGFIKNKMGRSILKQSLKTLVGKPERAINGAFGQ